MKEKIYIVGAGLSGLAAAITLEKEGFDPVICEGSSRVGGRVKTDLVEDYQLDHGFQVLLDAYPKAREYFDYKELELQRLLPGALLFTGKKVLKIGDPSRHFPFLLSTLEAGVASLRDLYLLWRLHRQVQSMTLDELFQQQEQKTMDFLIQKGFSDKIIRTFFKPFFSGIFLESELNTSSIMFQFVFKMFGKGYAAIPKGGMGALPQQLLKRLQRSTLHYNTKVKRVEDGKILLQNGSEIEADLILIATDPHGLLRNVKTDPVTWHSCDTLYFETERRVIKSPLIGLVSKEDALINNIFFPTSIATQCKGEKELLSVTVVMHHNLDESTLVSRVQDELRSICNIDNPRFLRRYSIKRALPSLNSIRSQRDEEKWRIGGKTFLAGDHLLYGSSNAALLSGELAARAMVRKLRGEQ